MKPSFKKAVSLVTASLLMTVGLIGVAAMPAQADSPTTVFDFESNTVGANGWSNMFGFAADNNGWANTVDSSTGLPAGSPAGGAKAIKATEGSGAYSGTNLGSVASTSSLIGAGSMAATVVFYSPTAGVNLRLKVEQANDNTYSHFVTADQSTVQGWQTLVFNFASPSSGSYDPSINYSIASVSYDPTSTTLQTLPYYVDQVVFAAGSGQQQSAPQTVDYDVRLISSQKNTATDTYEWTSCGGNSWCANNNYYMKMIAAGASTTLTYVVTQHGTATVVPSASVSLRMNTAYSGANATWSSNGTAYGAVSTSTASDAGAITGTTNSSGQVSFTFANTNSSGEATRTLNNANPYPSGCNSPAGQTKGALQPTVTAVSGAVVGNQYVDVLWPHVSSATINTSVAAGSDGSNCQSSNSNSGSNSVSNPSAQVTGSTQTVDPNNKGNYPHIRLETSFLANNYDASWWDGVWQYRDADSRAYLKYIPVGSTFSLTYYVTDASGAPLVGAPVSLIVNANYSCSKTYFAYDGALIGPDDCNGGGQSELPAKTTDAKGVVTFTLTNTNTVGEAMPTSLSGLPNGKELGTNIKPNLVGAKQQGIDMLFAHFVQPNDVAKATGAATQTESVGNIHTSTFSFVGADGKPLANQDVKYYINGLDSKVGFARTDDQGKATVISTNSSGQAGMQVVGVSLARDGKLPLTASTIITWALPSLSLVASAGKSMVVVDVTGAAGKKVSINISGKLYSRTAASAKTEFTFGASQGKHLVKVSVGSKSITQSVTVRK